MAILEMGSSSSKCMSCYFTGKTFAASPSENGHFTLLGWGKDNGQPGCGELWTEVRLTTYTGRPEEEVVRGIRQMYPNLAHLPIKYSHS